MFGVNILAAFTFFLATCSAAPAPLERRAISADLLARFNLAEQYAAASYCPGNNDSPGTKLTCSAGNCPIVEGADTLTLTEFKDSLITDSTGYVAISNTHSLIVVAFRGSKSVRNWLADITISDADTGLCPGCTAARGFWTSWTEVRSQVIAAVKLAKVQHPSYGILVTGHSLGGAIATLAAAELRTQGNQLALFTFGAPRIASSKLSAFISAQPGGNYRATHIADPVPKLPPLVTGFVHISPEYYIKSPNNVPVTTEDINVYQGAINLSGNTGQLSIDTAAHGWYFNNVGACSPGGFELRKRDEVEIVKYL